MSPLRPLLLALALAACSDPSERPSADAAIDLSRPDAPPDDVAPDVSLDQTADAALDVTPDVTAPDVAPDVTAPDVAPATLRVLFVGNSYVFYNDLPALLARLATAASRAGSGPTIEVASVTVGGATMRNHWDTGDAPRRMMAERWDAVVLQGQSVEPVLNTAEFRTYGARFGTLAGTYRTRPVYFATWPRRAGDSLYAQSWSGGSPEVFNMRLHTAYAQVAAQVMGTVAPVGNAWTAALRARPATPLYDPDGSHPSPTGTWLAACVIYRALTGLPASAASESAVTGVAPADVRALRELSAAP